MTAARLKLVLLLVALAAAFVAFYGLRLVSVADVRGWVEPFGAGGPVAYVVLATLLGAALVPGPLLAGVSGLLFGTLTGTAVTIAASVASAVLALRLGRAAGARGMQEVSGPRLEAAAAALARRGTPAVIVQRLVPGVPDGPCSYLAGTLGLRTRQIALGTLVGASPRAFSYTALGGSLGDLGSPTAIAALVVLGLTIVAGAALGGRALRRGRLSGAAGSPPPGR